MGIGKYILDGDGNPKPERSLLKWAMWLEHSHLSKGKDNRIVQQDRVGGVSISTVFLGLDHNFDDGPPVLWETMVFGGEHNQYQRRYASRDDAVIGHMEAVEIVKASQADLKELERMALAGGWEPKQ